MKVKINKIVKMYGKRTVLDIENLFFDKGKVYAILGPNGSGKTTMLRLIAGIDKPSSGEILYDNNISQCEISYLPQKPYMFDMSVLDNLTLAVGKNQSNQKEAESALEKVAMKKFAKAKVNSLSGGEAQRVALARTLMLKKELVLLDEPASGVDILSTKMIETYIRSVCDKDGAAVVFTTHSPSQAYRIADELLFLWNGRIIERGTPKGILDSPQSNEVKEFLKDWKI